MKKLIKKIMSVRIMVQIGTTSKGISKGIKH